MTLDIILLGFFVLMVFLGWRSGITGQLLRVIAAVCVIIGCAPASAMLREAVMDQDASVAAPLVEVASMAAAAVLIYIVVSVSGWLIIKAMRKTSDTLSWMDHAGGATLGALKAGLIVYICGVCAMLLMGPLEAVDPRDRLHMRDGRITHFVERYDVLAPWRFPDVARLERAMRIAHHAQTSRRGAQMLREEGAAADFVRKDAFVRLMERPDLVEAARYGRMPMILADDQARAFLNDPDVVESLRRTDWAMLEGEMGLTHAVPPHPREEGARAVTAQHAVTGE